MFDRDLITSPHIGEPGVPQSPRAIEFEQAECGMSVGNAIEASWGGIILAGGAFGASLVLASVLYPKGMRGSLSVGFLFELLMMMGVAGVIGLVLAAVSGGFSIACVMIVNGVSGGVVTRRSAIVLAGGLSGFLPIGLTFVGQCGMSDGLDLAAAVFFLLLNFAAMLFGTVGALWRANSKGVWENLKQELEYKQAQHQIWLKQIDGESHGQAGDSHSPFQFKIQHLLIGMIGCSCVLALDQLSANHEFLVACCLYGFLQVILLCIDWRYFKSYQIKLLQD